MKNKTLFKNNLKLIEIEVFSYCNRKCWFCPNSFIDRMSENKTMSEQDYIYILKQLKEIDFKGEITFSRYNEPLAFKKIILNRIELARKHVPNSILRINTNGDYLNRQYVLDLKKSGLNQLWVQQYLKNNEQYNHEKQKIAIDKKIKKLGFESQLLTDIEDYKIEHNLLIENFTCNIRARNFAKNGSDRGGVLKIAENYIRTEPCRQVHDNIYIDYNGKIMVCCAMRSDVKEHVTGFMGHIKEDKLYNIFQKETYKSWRKIHNNNKEKKGLCRGCKIGLV